ncbi:MAG: D-alanyl-D-alanine carboxypeptidase family protein [Ruminococcaceae bacterium]|nr:D-alanyl-D-alanine carboxypeptidase family protein [Oscillospiraceae bacterium]
MGQNKPTPSFNTVKKSNRQARSKRLRYSRILLLAIFAVVALLLFTCLIFIVCSITDHFKGDKPNSPNPLSIEYESITKEQSAIHEGALINVNLENKYTFPVSMENALKNIFQNSAKYDDIAYVYEVSYPDWLLNQETLAAFNTMLLKHYEETNDNNVRISSAYRDKKTQEDYEVPVEHSDFHTGYCVAIMEHGWGIKLPNNHWIFQNCHKFGFVIRYPEHKSEITGVSDYTHCLRYVGVAHATYMTQNDLCLEEYTKLLQNYTKDSALQITGMDGHKYAVYYAPATTEVTTIQVPKNYNYTVSGDNIGGFIITVHLDEPKNA